MNWNINNVDNNNDDFVKSYISIPILLLVISLGLIGLTACIAALVKKENRVEIGQLPQNSTHRRRTNCSGTLQNNYFYNLNYKNNK